MSIDRAYGAAREAIMSADTDDVTRCTAIALMAGYTARWGNHEWVTEAVEEEFVLPLVNPATGATSRTFTWAGKRDARAFFDGRRFIVEHKTAGEDIRDPNSAYWRKLAIDGQVSAYALASWQQGEKVDGTLYDVIRKPTIRPREITKKERAEIASMVTYFGQKVSDGTRQLAIENEKLRENGELYGLRLQADIASDPAKYFQRRTIMRLDHELVEFAGELWDIGQEIRQANVTEKHYRNASACVSFGTCCEFLGVCSGHTSIDSDRWEHAENPHRELKTADADSLTNSRIKCFMACRRKHHYRYNLGLSKPEGEEAEALRFGTLIHSALECWWRAFIPLESSGNGNGATGFAAIEVASPGTSQTQLAE